MMMVLHWRPAFWRLLLFDPSPADELEPASGSDPPPKPPPDAVSARNAQSGSDRASHELGLSILHQLCTSDGPASLDNRFAEIHIKH